jgi:murein DD-endopeptidase MepM/ murein hydrolase activator NlpD
VPRSLALLATLVLIAATPAAADLHGRKHAVEHRIASVEARIAAARAREAQLSTEIGQATARIRTLEANVGDVTQRLTSLESDLALHRSRLAKIEELLTLQTRQLRFLKAQYRIALTRLNRRLVEIYESDQPTTLEVVLAARSFHDLLDQLDYFGVIARNDVEVTNEVARAKQRMRLARARTTQVRVSVAAETRVVAYRTAQQAALRDRLVAARSGLAHSQADKRQALAATRRSEQAWIAEAGALREASARISAEIAAAQAAPPVASGTSGASAGGASSSGLIWPVSGPITSPFGMRWGSLHPGIDIGAGYGTPIRAAAAGRVIVSGYNGGYGNLIVIDHGRGLATAYAHQSRLAASVGQSVSQGQVIGYVGSTGFSTGPHLHFEVRVNGTPVDPLGYL